MPASELLVFDIKRFAMHDGDGIRTTVFLKGCSLRCQWCQNPEGLEHKQNLLWLKNKCLHCGLCRKAGRPGQLHWATDHPVLDRTYQGDWQNLVDICPSGAMNYDSCWYSVDELMRQIRKDEPFFRHGGGVTFSGGEPLLSGESLLEVLERCHKENIHTCMETALYVPLDIVCKAAPLLDQIYCDLKVFDSDRHEHLTGKRNELIKENLRWLLLSEHAAKTTVRTPLIPGMTDSIDNIQAIAGWISSIDPDVKYEMLNYNELAPAKYPMTGRTYLPGIRKKLNPEQINVLKEAARKAGIKNLI